MTPEQLHALMARLRGTWPGEWDEERVAVWVETLGAYDYAVAVTAIRAMAAECEFASIAAFTRHARGAGGVVVDGERMFLPGTGWVPEVVRTLDLAPAGAIQPHDGPVIPIAEARRRLEEARRRIIKRPTA